MTDKEFLQSLREDEFSELVLIPLLEAMGYDNVRYTHGTQELGKDIVFRRNDPIDGAVLQCAVVKMKQLTGSVSDAKGTREVLHQVLQSIKDPYVDPQTGDSTPVEKAYVVTPFTIKPPAANSIKSELKDYRHRVAFVDGPALVSLLQKHLPTIQLSIQTPERRFLYSFLQRLDARTSQSLSPHTKHTLLDVYTTCTLSPTTPDEARLASFAEPQIAKEFLDPAITISRAGYSVVLADVGSGKTSLLQKLSVELIGSRLESGSGPIPVFIPLHRLEGRSFRDKTTLLEALTDFVQTEGHYAFEPSSNSSYVLLLDGFDEISQAHDQAQRAIDGLKEQFSRIVVTARPSRIPKMSDRFSYYILNPFSSDDIRSFLGKWFPDQYALADSVHKRIMNDPSVRVFCRTPLMLTLYATLAEMKPLDQLPTRRTPIYEMVVDTLLGTWDDIRGVRNVFPADVKTLVLELVAHETHSRGQRTFRGSELRGAVKQAQESSASRGLPADSEQLERELVYRTSLLRPSGSDSFEFAHLSVQEFFAARRLMRIGSQRIAEQTMFEDWWRGVWIFFFGMKRTLDDVPLAKGSRVRRADALRSYLVEADYTSSATRKRIVGLIASELLVSPTLPLESVRHFAEYGVELVESMSQEVRRPGFGGNSTNAILVSLAVGDSRSLQWLVEETRIVGSLDYRDAVTSLAFASKIIQQSRGIELFERLLDRITASFATMKRGGTLLQTWDELAVLSRTLTRVSQDTGVPTEHAHRAWDALRTAGREIAPELTAHCDSYWLPWKTRRSSE